MKVNDVEVDDELMKFIDEKGYELVGFRIPKEGEKYISVYSGVLFDICAAGNWNFENIFPIIRKKFKWPDFISEDYKYCARTRDNFHVFFKDEPSYNERNESWSYRQTNVYIHESFFKEKLYDDYVDSKSSLRKR